MTPQTRERGLAVAADDNRRPEQVEMFLDGQRPEVTERKPIAAERHVDVCAIGPEPEPSVLEIVQAPHQTDRPREQRERDRQDCVIEWEYPQRPARVKVSKSVRRILGVVEYPRDEEPREHEEEVDTTPSGRGQPEKETARQGLPRHGQSEVVDENK